MPVLGSLRFIADDGDISRVATSKATLVRHPDEFDRERIEAHESCGNGIDSHLVGAGKNHVFHMGNHAAWTWAVAGKRAVHHGKDPPMDLLLDHEQIDESLVDHRMGPMPAFVKQP